MPKEGKWVWFEFIEMSESGKTERYIVRAKQGNVMLGDIRWFAGWRKYAFFPYADRVFEQDCLRDIALFLEQLMEARQ